jgi:hypothetical protein
MEPEGPQQDTGHQDQAHAAREDQLDDARGCSSPAWSTWSTHL